MVFILYLYRRLPARSATCLKLSDDALARRPQPMLSTHTFIAFFFGHVFGAEGCKTKFPSS